MGTEELSCCWERRMHKWEWGVSQPFFLGVQILFQKWFLSFVTHPKIILRTRAVTNVSHAHIFSDNEECSPWLQYGVCKRPQKVICKWKNIPRNKRFEALCTALSRKRSKRWSICGVWVPEVRKGASCKEWLFNPSDRARTRINNCKLKPEKLKQK